MAIPTCAPDPTRLVSVDPVGCPPRIEGTGDTCTSQPQHVDETVPYLLPHPVAMESMNKKEKRTPPPPSPADSADGDDRISALDDDLRELILRLAHLNVRELVRTSVLSKQWRGLWKRLPVLDFFTSPELESVSNVRQYIAIVNDVLEQRAGATSEARIDEVKIPLLLEVPEARIDNDASSLYGQRQQLLTPAMEAAEAWIRYAMHHQVKCFEFKLYLLPLGNKTHVMDLELLPSSPKLERIRLGFSCVGVQLPRTAVFSSLKDLTLEFVELAVGSGHLLARLLSSMCCPSLQKLCMMHVNFECGGTKELVLDNGELLELSMEGVKGMELLELRTPKLLYLKIDLCYFESLRVSAPGLKDLTYVFNTAFIHGPLPHVWRLKIDLITHEEVDDDDDDDDDDDGDPNSCNICLLKRCSSSVRCLVVDLHVPLEYGRGDDLIKDKIPQLPNVTSLLIGVVVLRDRHTFRDGVAGLLSRFENLEYLSLELDDSPDICCKKNITCNHSGHWESRDIISLANLRKADFKGINGTCCELRFLQFVLASATDLQSVTLSFNRCINPEAEVQDSRIEHFQRKLLGDGTWTACENEDVLFKSYEWTPSP